MGGSNWSDEFYNDREEERKRTGAPAFVYHAAVASGAVPKKTHNLMSPFGVKVREARDSPAHPESLPIIVFFDVTGSMETVPKTLQKKLLQLMGLLVRKGYVTHPQILFGGVGDETCDAASLQVGQFESGIEMDDDLGKIFLEGGGGGQMTESYQNAIYFAARHTATDAWDKRQKKGFLFLIGDEMPYGKVSKAEAKKVFDDTLEADIPVSDIVRECQKRYHVFYILPNNTSHFNNKEVESAWVKLLGRENFIKLADPNAVCEAIATAVGLCEGTVDLDGASADLKDAGASVAIVKSVSAALGDLAKSTALARVGTGNLPEASAGVARL